MANADYIRRNVAAPFCPTAILTSNLTQDSGTLTFSTLLSPIPNPIQTNRAALIDDEIVGITGISGNTLTISRGCCDTIPERHFNGTTIWFFDDSVGSDDVEYGATETVGVKLLPKTTTSGTIPVEGSPPNELTFNFRFARPYPPGRVLINDEPWHTANASTVANTTDLTISWAHRDRITQADQLVAHGAAGIGPEAGVTYKIVVRRSDTNAVIRTVTGITDDEWVYDGATLFSDLLAPSAEVQISIELSSMRGSLESLYKYVMTAAVSPPPPPLSFVAENYVGTGSTVLTIPTHQAGDLLVLFERSNSTAVPPTPSGWTAELSDPVTGGIGRGWKVSTRIDANNSVTAITVTSDSQKSVAIYRGAAGVGDKTFIPFELGPQTKAFPALTLQTGSWVFGAMVNNQSATITLTGMTTRRSMLGTITGDTDAPVSAVAASGSWNVDAYVSAASVEILSAQNSLTAQLNPLTDSRTTLVWDGDLPFNDAHYDSRYAVQAEIFPAPSVSYYPTGLLHSDGTPWVKVQNASAWNNKPAITARIRKGQASHWLPTLRAETHGPVDGPSRVDERGHTYWIGFEFAIGADFINNGEQSSGVPNVVAIGGLHDQTWAATGPYSSGQDSLRLWLKGRTLAWGHAAPGTGNWKRYDVRSIPLNPTFVEGEAAGTDFGNPVEFLLADANVGERVAVIGKVTLGANNTYNPRTELWIRQGTGPLIKVVDYVGPNTYSEGIRYWKWGLYSWINTDQWWGTTHTRSLHVRSALLMENLLVSGLPIIDQAKILAWLQR